MNKQKQTYVSPETDLFVIRFEQGILTGSVNAGAPTTLPSYTEDYDDWD